MSHHNRPAQVHLFAMCLNELRMIPHFLRHYAGLVTHFHIFDNGSTDESLRQLSGDPRIVVEPFKTEGDSFVLTAQRLMNTAWNRSREADWIITAEMDEHLHHPDLPAYLRHCAGEGVTALHAVGYDMIARDFPAGGQPLYEQVVRGTRSLLFDKMAIFDPRAIVDSNYLPGRHQSNPTGRVVWERHRQVKLLHFKTLGADYVTERNITLKHGLRADDLSNKWGDAYLRGREQVEQDIDRIFPAARRVPGLSTPGDPLDQPTFEEEKALLVASDLFDADYYSRTNPDVAGSGIDPLVHFCISGCGEGRRPNALFDPVFYTAAYGLSARGKNNALVDYLLVGEATGRRPSAEFDPAIYRDVNRLLPHQSVLRHALGTG